MVRGLLLPGVRARVASDKDNFRTYEDVQRGPVQPGSNLNLIIGIDLTKSNEWTGKSSFQGRQLHAICHPTVQPV